MKIGITTLHRSMNYGAILQAYALKTFLSKYGVVKVIDYDYLITKTYNTRREFLDLYECDTYYDFLFKHLKDANVSACFQPIKTFQSFSDFKKKHLNLTEKLSKAQILNGQLERFDCIVSGSDQLWNARPGRWVDEVFYQQFPGEFKRVAYAASIGGWEFTEAELELVKKYIKTFDLVSLREQDDAKKFSDITEMEITDTLDPVFLLGGEEWKRFSSFSHCEEKYILVYQPTGAGQQWFTASYKHIADNLNLKIKYVTQGFFEQLNDMALPDLYEFVGLIANAGFVFTNSFHGTAFSIIFNRPFAVTYSPVTFNRISCILEKLSIHGRIVRNLQDVYNLNYEMDYENTNALLKKEIERSIAFIDRAFA